VTPDQSDKVLSRLTATWRARMGKGVREVWGDALCDLDFDAVMAGIDQLARTEAKLPSLAAVRQAATGRHATATAFDVAYQVLVTWSDENGLAFAEPSRWHTTEASARDDYELACKRVEDLDAGTVELMRYEAGRPPRSIERTR